MIVLTAGSLALVRLMRSQGDARVEATRRGARLGLAGFAENPQLQDDSLWPDSVASFRRRREQGEA